MRVEGLHNWLDLVVTKPTDEKEEDEFAVAISPSIFGDFAREPGYEIILPARIGGVALVEGVILEAYGNTGAHSGDEVHPVYITIREKSQG